MDLREKVLEHKKVNKSAKGTVAKRYKMQRVTAAGKQIVALEAKLVKAKTLHVETVEAAA